MRGPDFVQFDAANLPLNDSIAPRAIVTMALSYSAACITLGLRLWCRGIKSRKLGWDDGMIGLAMVSALVQLVFNSVFLRYGEGRHVVYLKWHEIAVAYKFSGLVMFPFIFCTALTKISIACMVLRLTQTRGMKVAMYLLIVSLILVNGGCVVILFTYCQPSYAIWDINVKDAKCADARVLDWGSSVQGVWSILTDLMCTSLPIFMVWRLQMGRDQKVAVTILIGFGLVATVCSVGRCVYYATTSFAPNQTRTGINLVIWTTLEDNLGIFAANLPALGFLLNLKRFVPEFGCGRSRAFHMFEKKSWFRSDFSQTPQQSDALGPSSITLGAAAVKAIPGSMIGSMEQHSGSEERKLAAAVTEVSV